MVLKTSQWPYDDFLADRQFRDLSYLGLAAIAQSSPATDDLTRTTEQETTA